MNWKGKSTLGAPPGFTRIPPLAYGYVPPTTSAGVVETRVDVPDPSADINSNGLVPGFPESLDLLSSSLWVTSCGRASTTRVPSPDRLPWSATDPLVVSIPAGLPPTTSATPLVEVLALFVVSFETRLDQRLYLTSSSLSSIAASIASASLSLEVLSSSSAISSGVWCAPG